MALPWILIQYGTDGVPPVGDPADNFGPPPWGLITYGTDGDAPEPPVDDGTRGTETVLSNHRGVGRGFGRKRYEEFLEEEYRRLRNLEKEAERAEAKAVKAEAKVEKLEAKPTVTKTAENKLEAAIKAAERANEEYLAAAAAVEAYRLHIEDDDEEVLSMFLAMFR
jgi:hypothetical protein